MVVSKQMLKIKLFKAFVPSRSEPNIPCIFVHRFIEWLCLSSSCKHLPRCLQEMCAAHKS